MRTTFRTWTWEYGGLIVVSGLLILPFYWIIGLWALIPTIPYLVYSLYCAHLISKYPVRGDLPEWRQWESRVGADDYRD